MFYQNVADTETHKHARAHTGAQCEGLGHVGTHSLSHSLARPTAVENQFGHVMSAAALTVTHILHMRIPRRTSAACTFTGYGI